MNSNANPNNNNSNPILNLNINLPGAGTNAAAEPVLVQMLPQQVVLEGVAPPQGAPMLQQNLLTQNSAHAHPSMVRPHGPSQAHSILSRFATFDLSFGEGWPQGPLCAVTMAIIAAADAFLSYVVLVSCRSNAQFSSGPPFGAGDALGEWWPVGSVEAQGAQGQAYEACISDPLVNMHPMQLALAASVLAVLFVPLRKTPEIAFTLAAALFAFRVEARTYPFYVSFLGRGLLGLICAVAGHPTPTLLPPSALNIVSVFSLVQAVQTHCFLPQYYSRAVNKKWLRSRAYRYSLVCRPLVIGCLSLVIVFLRYVSDWRSVLHSVLLLPPIVFFYAPMLTTLLEAGLMAGPWAPLARGAFTREWMWWVHTAMLWASQICIDGPALALGRRSAVKELAAFRHISAARAKALDADAAADFTFRVTNRVLPQEVLHRSRDSFMRTAQGSMMVLLSFITHSGWLWAVIPLASTLAPLYFMHSPAWLLCVIALIIIPLFRFVALPLPQEYATVACCSPPKYDARAALGTAADGYAVEGAAFDWASWPLRFLYRITNGFIGTSWGRARLESSGYDAIPARIMVTSQTAPGMPATQREETVTFSCLGLRGALSSLKEKADSPPHLRVSPLSPSEFLAHISSDGDLPEQIGSADDQLKAERFTMPYQARPISALFSYLAAKYAPVEGHGLDADREAFVALLQVLFTCLRTPSPEQLLGHFQTGAFRALVRVAIGLCGRAAARPPIPSPFGAPRRLQCYEWPSAQTDHEVVSHMLPPSGMLLQMAAFVLDTEALHAHGVAVSLGPSDADVEGFVDDRVADGRLGASEAKGLAARRLLLAAEWRAAQQPLHDEVMSCSDTLCAFITFRESIYDSAAESALPAFILRPDPARPTAPYHATVDVEPITVSENTMLNMRGAAAQLLSACLRWDDGAPLPSGEAEGDEEVGLGDVQRRFRRSQRRLASRGLARGGEQAHPLHNLAKFTKAVLYVVSKRRYLRALTTGFYAEYVELLATLLLPSEREREAAAAAAAASVGESGARLDTCSAESSAAPSASASLSAAPLSSPSSWLLAPFPNVRMYHRTGDAALMPAAPLPHARLPFRLRPYDSTMRVQDLLLALFDADHWGIMATLATDPLTRLGLCRGEALAAAVLGMPLPPPRVPAQSGDRSPSSFVDAEKTLVSPNIMMSALVARSSSGGGGGADGHVCPLLDDALLRHHMRSTSVAAAASLVPQLWTAMQQRLLNQLTVSMFSTSVPPEPMPTELRTLQQTMAGTLLRIEGLLGVATAVLRSDPLGYAAAADVARSAAFSTVVLEMRRGLLSTAKHTNGLVSRKRGGNAARGLSGILDPYAVLDDGPIALLFGLGAGPARAYAEIPNADRQPMATRALRLPLSDEALIAEADAELIFEPLVEPLRPQQQQQQQQPTAQNGAAHQRPASRVVLTAVPPIPLDAAPAGNTAAAAAPLRAPAMYLTPLDMHRWLLLGALMHSSCGASSFEVRVRRLAMARRVLIAADELRAAATALACRDKGFAVVGGGVGDATDVCTVCLEALDGKGRWAGDADLLAPEQWAAIAPLARKHQHGGTVGGGVGAGAGPLALCSARLPLAVRQFADVEGAVESVGGASPNPTVRTACGHEFHLGCLVGVLRNAKRGRGRCPMCRAALSGESPLASTSTPPPETLPRAEQVSAPIPAPIPPPSPANQPAEDDRDIYIAPLD